MIFTVVAFSTLERGVELTRDRTYLHAAKTAMFSDSTLHWR